MPNQSYDDLNGAMYRQLGFFRQSLRDYSKSQPQIAKLQKKLSGGNQDAAANTSRAREEEQPERESDYQA